MDFEVVVVVVGQERDGEERLGMLAKIGGDVADAKPAIGVSVVVVRFA